MKARSIFPFYKIGHFINQPHNPTEFEILRFGKMEEPQVDDYHKHSFYEILWTEKGQSRQIIDYNAYKIRPNSLFFISPNQVHHFEEWKPLKGGTILFTEDFYLLDRTSKNTLFELSFLDNLYSNPCVEFSPKAFTQVLGLIHQLELEHNRKDRNPAIIQSFLHILLARVQRHVDKSLAPGSKKYLVQFKRFKETLEQYFAENHTAAFYSGKLNITQHHLNLVCREVTGHTATGIIQNRSVLEAKRMLTFSGKTVSEIAHDLNYTDSSYLARVFKAKTGLSPGEFKMQMSEKYRTK